MTRRLALLAGTMCLMLVGLSAYLVAAAQDTPMMSTAAPGLGLECPVVNDRAGHSNDKIGQGIIDYPAGASGFATPEEAFEASFDDDFPAGRDEYLHESETENTVVFAYRWRGLRGATVTVVKRNGGWLPAATALCDVLSNPGRAEMERQVDGR